MSTGYSDPLARSRIPPAVAAVLKKIGWKEGKLLTAAQRAEYERLKGESLKGDHAH